MRFSSRLKTALLTLTLISALGITAAAADVGIVAAGQLDILQGPSAEDAVISSLPEGVQVPVLGKVGDFYRIRYDSKVGYVNSADLAVIDMERTGLVTASALNIRKSPVTGAVLTKLLRGTSVTILETDANTGWHKIALDHGFGWCSPEYILETTTQSPEDDSAFGQQVVAEAKKYLGYRYRYGGSSPSTGFDCSGLTSYVYRQCGLAISRTATAQYADGISVEISALQPGDLVFFRNSSSGSRIGHVGIYVGDGQYIHSPSPGRTVTIESLTNSWSSRYYYGACRILH